MAPPAEAMVLLLDAGATTVAWARDVLPPAEVDAVLGGRGGSAASAAAAAAAADPTAPPPNPRVFDVLRSAAMRLVATRFCYFSKQDRLGLVVMGQPVLEEEEEDEEDGSGDSDREEGEAGGDSESGGGAKKGDQDEGVIEDSACLVHPVTKVTFALMQKLRQLPIAGAETVFRDGIVRAGGHMMVMTAGTKVCTRRILLLTDGRTACTAEDQDLFIEAVGAMHQEGMRLDVVIPGLAQLPDYDVDDDAFAGGEADASDVDMDGPASPPGGERPPRKRARSAPGGDPMGGESDRDGAEQGSADPEGEDEAEGEDGTAMDPTLRRAFAPDEVDAEVRARLEHSAAAGGVRKTEAQARNEALLRRAAAVTGGLSLSLAALCDFLSTPRKRSVKPIAKYAGTLSLSPTVHIPVRAYTATMEVRLPTCTRISWARSLEVGHHVPAKRQTTYTTLGNSDETLEAEDTMSAYAYGSDIVPVSAEVDATLVRHASGPKSLRVLGFVPLSTIPQHYFLGGVDAVVAMGEIPESRTGLGALATAMLTRKRGAIARMVMRDDAAAQLKFLWADELPPADHASSDDDEEPGGEEGGEGTPGATPAGARQQRRPFLYMVSVPLADGIRSYAFPSLQPKVDVLTSAQRAAVDNLIDAFDLDAPPPSDAAAAMADDDDGGGGGGGGSVPGSQDSTATATATPGGGGIDCAAVFNPALHLFFAAAVQRALDGVEGKTLPRLPPSLAAPLRPESHVRDPAEACAAVERLAELLPTRRVDPRSVRKEKNFFAANPDGSARLLGAFLPDAFDDDGVDPLAGLTAAAEAAPLAEAVAGAAGAAAATAPTAVAAAAPESASASQPPLASEAGLAGQPGPPGERTRVGPPTTSVAPPPVSGRVGSLSESPSSQQRAAGAAVQTPSATTASGAQLLPLAVDGSQGHAGLAPPPPVAMDAALEEVSEITAAAPTGRGGLTNSAAAGAATKDIDEAPMQAESDDDGDASHPHGNPNDAFDVSALRTQIEATQRVADSQAESRLFSYATRTTGNANGSVAPTTPAGGAAAAAASPASAAAIWAVGDQDPVGDFQRILAAGDADSAVAAEELTDILRSRVRTRDFVGATAALAALRSGCISSRIGDAYNAAARKLVASANAASPLLAGPAVAFLGHILRLPAADGGGAAALSLVTEAEGGPACAPVTARIVGEFDRLVAAAAARRVGAPPPPPPS